MLSKPMLNAVKSPVVDQTAMSSRTVATSAAVTHVAYVANLGAFYAVYLISQNQTKKSNIKAAKYNT